MKHVCTVLQTNSSQWEHGGSQLQLLSFTPNSRNQYGFSSPLAADIQLVRADLIKSWNDQPRALPQQTTPSLKVAFVPRISQQSSVVPPSPQHQYQPHHQTTGTIFRQGSILPPTGVLPPSTLTRTVVIGGSKTYSDPSVHRFAPVHRVVPIQRVTVVPENSYQQQSRTRPTNFYYPAGGSIPSHRTNPLVPVPRTVVHPAAAAAPVASNLPFTTLRLQQNRPTEGLPVSHRQTVQQVPVAASNRDISYAPPLQLLRRSDDALPEALTSTSAVPRKLKTTTVLQVVPALSFYLNDVQEKRAFDEAVRKGLFDERRRNGQVYTSYDVPLGSVGHLGAAY
uniref:Uncharacterized protein n=1 Tax=Anopheles christyi TaxID=43041 RepID=A0A182K4Q7_9DIPT